MNSMIAFEIGKANRGREMMVFDWIKAANLIKENKTSEISAGLAGDWEWTGDVIWSNGKPYKGYAYLASTWATPEISIDREVQDCFIMESEHPGWGSGTFFPKEALDILGLTDADLPGGGL